MPEEVEIDYIKNPLGITKIIAGACCLIACILMFAGGNRSDSFMAFGIIFSFLFILALIDLILRGTNSLKMDSNLYPKIDMTFCACAAGAALCVTGCATSPVSGSWGYIANEIIPHVSDVASKDLVPLDKSWNNSIVVNLRAVDNFLEPAGNTTAFVSSTSKLNTEVSTVRSTGSHSTQVENVTETEFSKLNTTGRALLVTLIDKVLMEPDKSKKKDIYNSEESYGDSDDDYTLNTNFINEDLSNARHPGPLMSSGYYGGSDLGTVKAGVAFGYFAGFAFVIIILLRTWYY